MIFQKHTYDFSGTPCVSPYALCLSHIRVGSSGDSAVLTAGGEGYALMGNRTLSHREIPVGRRLLRQICQLVRRGLNPKMSLGRGLLSHADYHSCDNLPTLRGILLCASS